MSLRAGAAAALALALLLAAPAGAQMLPAAEVVAGRWVGAKLRCQKEEAKLVRCGTPSPFEVTFDGAGTGSTPEEGLPGQFAWRWVSGAEIALAPAAGGDEIRLFGIELEGDALTFQAYVYLPTADPNAPAEARYIHYVFDVTRAP